MSHNSTTERPGSVHVPRQRACLGPPSQGHRGRPQARHAWTECPRPSYACYARRLDAASCVRVRPP